MSWQKNAPGLPTFLTTTMTVMTAKPETATPAEKIDAFLVSSYEAMLMARYEGPFDKRVLEFAQKTAAAWRQIAQRLRICLDDPVRAVG